MNGSKDDDQWMRRRGDKKKKGDVSLLSLYEPADDRIRTTECMGFGSGIRTEADPLLLLISSSETRFGHRMPIIKLKSSDNEVFDVDVEVAKASVTIKTMIDDLGLKDETEEVSRQTC